MRAYRERKRLRGLRGPAPSGWTVHPMSESTQPAEQESLRALPHKAAASSIEIAYRPDAGRVPGASTRGVSFLFIFSG